MTDLPLNLLKRGDFSRVPVIFGANLDDALTYGQLEPYNVSSGKQWCYFWKNLDVYTQAIRADYGPYTSQILAMYPNSSDSTANRIMYNQLYADVYFRWVTHKMVLNQKGAQAGDQWEQLLLLEGLLDSIILYTFLLAHLQPL